MADNANAVELIEAALRVLRDPSRDAKALAAGMLTVAVAILAVQSGMDLELVVAGVRAEHARALEVVTPGAHE